MDPFSVLHRVLLTPNIVASIASRLQPEKEDMQGRNQQGHEPNEKACWLVYAILSRTE